MNENCLSCDKKLIRRYPATIKTYCNHTCQQNYHYEKYIKEWKLGKHNGMRGHLSISLRIRKYLFKKYDNQCARCGWNKKNPATDNVPLEVEHIDGDHKNNKEKNLILLCPNCHSLTPTYKNLNKGNGRKNR